MQKTLVPMKIPALFANFTNIKFMYSDNKYYELCSQMANLLQKMRVTKDNCHIL